MKKQGSGPLNSFPSDFHPFVWTPLITRFPDACFPSSVVSSQREWILPETNSPFPLLTYLLCFWILSRQRKSLRFTGNRTARNCLQHNSIWKEWLLGSSDGIKEGGQENRARDCRDGPQRVLTFGKAAAHLASFQLTLPRSRRERLFSFSTSTMSRCSQLFTIENNARELKPVLRDNLVSQQCPTLRPHRLQHDRPPCPSPSPEVCSDSCPSSPWCHPAISSSVAPLLLPPSVFPSISLSHQSFQ